MIHSPQIIAAIKFLEDRGFRISVDIQQIVLGNNRLDVIEAIKSGKLHSRELKQAGDYSAIRDGLWSIIYDAVYEYLSGTNTVRTYQNEVKRAVTEAYSSTGDVAYQDGGAELPVDEDTSTMITSEMSAQLNYVDSLFQTLKALRNEGDFSPELEAGSTADKWSSALDGFYNAVKLSAAGNKMLTWNLGDTERHCDTCLSLDGERHRASWFISRNYLPHKPGSNTECGGYHCDCSLTDDDGEEFTI